MFNRPVECPICGRVEGVTLAGVHTPLLINNDGYTVWVEEMQGLHVSRDIPMIDSDADLEAHFICNDGQHAFVLTFAYSKGVTYVTADAEPK